MHPMLQKLVTSEFMNENQAKVIQEAVDNKDTVIASGHRSAAVRPLLATLMTMAKANDTKQVKAMEDITDDTEYILLPGLGVDNFEEYVQKAFEAKPPMITIKEPEHPYSMMKVMKLAAKASGNTDKQTWLLECRKVDNIPRFVENHRFYYNEKGKFTLEKQTRD